ncbi:MAG: pyridoxal-phosphate dependent enzyme [Planctomycetes bacterium]|nr:pyridoxal-phosphate dependent enzyme [Planctomycetota bacterium]
MIELARIRSAAELLRGRVHRTPLLSSTSLGAMAGVELWLKCESLQKTGSFKARGALHRVLRLSADERARGLITVSAGNHAAAVAWAARQIGAPCAVVMPEDAPQAKLDAVRGYGAELILHRDRAALFERLERERVARGAVFVHPFDDPDVLAGAGTVGLEILEDVPNLDMVVVPVGGGGLMGGVASAIKAQRPEVRVVAVELAGGPGLTPALAAGEPVPVKRPATLADGMTPPFVGALPLQIARTCVDRIALVREEELRHAMRLLATRAKLWVEASGAAAVAAVLGCSTRSGSAGEAGEHPASALTIPQGARVVAVVSGGNLDGRCFDPDRTG